MKLGICAAIENMERVKELGYDYIELPVTAVAGLNEEEFRLLRERAESGKILCEAFNIMFPGDMRLIGKGVNSAAISEYIAAAIRKVSILGGKTIVFGSGRSRKCPEGWDYDRAYRQLKDICTKLGDEAAKYGITIVIEPLNKGETNMINSVAEGLKLTREVNHPNVKLLADFYHMRVENESMDIIAEAGPYLKHLHIANGHGRTFPRSPEEEDYRSFFHALKSINYEGGLSVEGATQQFDIDAPLSLTLLRELYYTTKE